jgi:hypothetical protein
MKLGSSLAVLAVLLSAGPVMAQTATPSAAPSDSPPAAGTPTPTPDATPAPTPAPAPLPLPTTGEAVQVLAALDNVCIPLINHADVRATAKAAGMRVNGDGQIYLSIPGGDKITVAPPSPANPTNCGMTVVYDTGGGDALRDGLAAWASHQPTPMPPEKAAVSNPEDGGVSIISTWVNYGATTTEGLIYIQHKKADGSPLNATHEQADVILSIRPS